MDVLKYFCQGYSGWLFLAGWMFRDIPEHCWSRAEKPKFRQGRQLWCRICWPAGRVARLMFDFHCIWIVDGPVLVDIYLDSSILFPLTSRNCAFTSRSFVLFFLLFGGPWKLTFATHWVVIDMARVALIYLDSIEELCMHLSWTGCFGWIILYLRDYWIR